MVQRLLAARNERESRLALFSSWIVIAVQFTLFLLIGSILFVYYLETEETALAGRQDLSAVHLEQSAAWNRGIGDRRNPGGRDVEPERRFECARVDYDHGFLQTDYLQAWAWRQVRGTLPEARALDDGDVGRHFVPDRLDRAKLGVSAGGGPVDRFHPVRRAAGGVSIWAFSRGERPRRARWLAWLPA